MEMSRGAGALVRGLVWVGLVVLVAGCGTERGGGGDGAEAGRSAAARASGAPSDFPCPGESAAPAPSTPDGGSAPGGAPGDHYAENHGFMEPFPLHGRKRCAGIEAVGKVERALEPLRGRADFDPVHARAALVRLGYADGAVSAYQNGPTGVGFLVDTFPVCVKGTMNLGSVEATAFGGYPDHPGCDRPSGGH
ncbi:hypothetical protein AB0J21_10080 [Streptomyces sp. NPDC049954]|uniref:hypothetical protein n=1 Tax=Streptomyces sp. NPDC049954 TaxID=3155779 RepID=UPI00342996B6